MQFRARLLGALVLGVAPLMGTAAIAADLPKEGTSSGTYPAYGTFKASPVGKELVLVATDENGLTVGNGLGDHMTWHCWGLQAIAKGMAEFHGYCVGTDPDGDQFAQSYASDGKFAADAKTINGVFTDMAGTGKYAGISGGGKFVSHAPEFRSAAEGTFLSYVTYQGSYKLP